jgi:hypothetical protein
MSRQAKTYISPEENLADERRKKDKNEYYDGEIFAMTGQAESTISSLETFSPN